jgi:hypothetical protein
MDFKQIIDCIFFNKEKYWEITDEDKEKNFFIINKKFSRKYPEMSQLFNDKNIDKSIALDNWFFFFKDINYIPKWYWNSKKKKISVSKISGPNILNLRKRLDITENDINFIYKYYKTDLDDYLKRIKKYDIL